MRLLALGTLPEEAVAAICTLRPGMLSGPCLEGGPCFFWELFDSPVFTFLRIILYIVLFRKAKTKHTYSVFGWVCDLKSGFGSTGKRTPFFWVVTVYVKGQKEAPVFLFYSRPVIARLAFLQPSQPGHDLGHPGRKEGNGSHENAGSLG